ncbi:MAG: polymer-forming cytoskeletal protein [Deltaproteobacteria bacterium]|jgi:cytoskeletal protein CcmA (bactofilin family)|nr:polymer-forming cytoskeletal protein [Deltaproteobacteria bacterium]
MFGIKKSDKQLWNAFFSMNVEIEGTLRFTGLLNIDGRVKGAIIAKGMLVTGTSAFIEGDVYVENLVLSGSVTGNIYATGEVHLNQTAVVRGNINYHTLSIVPGAVHEGNSHLFTEGEVEELTERIHSEIANIEKSGLSLDGKKAPKGKGATSPEPKPAEAPKEQQAASMAEKEKSFKKEREVSQLNVLNDSLG